MNEGPTRGSIWSPSFAVECVRPSTHKDDDWGPSAVKSCLAHHNKEQRKNARVTFQNGQHLEKPVSDSGPSMPPLLGYDWIAGVLDVEKSLEERSDDFYNDLQDFRMLNESECMQQPQPKYLSDKPSVMSLFADTDSLNVYTHNHQCTFLYKLNSRLFPVPIDPDESCPLCSRPKWSHPHTNDKPALVRVSIPHSTLLPPYDYKPPCRNSFNPADSLGLSSNCLLGWSNTVRSYQYLQPPSNLDLRSHVEKRTEPPEDDMFTAFSFDQAPPLTPLPRYHFEHISPKKKRKRRVPLFRS
ncbi:migration and invasion-inhibitory protein [Syngnathus scovelli]|uniref:migration and invasion-inhibitory protein n=1 Tax=Syngnathus scovelli TaxID=161590 RepID=UPI00210F61CC|nr:migration and invasion-inhibitory protein [Syngnathus scovelli]